MTQSPLARSAETGKGERVERVNDDTRGQYRTLLRLYRTDRKKDPLPNRFPWHGQSAVLELLELARDTQSQSGNPVTIRVLTGSSPDHVYWAGAEEVWHEFLRAGGRLKVLVWNDSLLKCGDAFQKLYGAYKTVELRLSGTRELGHQILHFFVVDDTGYRLEAPHEPFEQVIFSDYFPEIPARICFNDEAGAKQLVDYFDKSWDFCSEVPRNAADSTEHKICHE